MNSSNNHALPALIGDIGGTNARFQIVLDRDRSPLEFESIRTADFATIEDAIQQAVLEKTDIVPKTAILAAAGPITGDGLNLTNCYWNIQPTEFLRATPIGALVLMNDFEAQALSLPFLTCDDLVELGEAVGADQQGNKVVLGPGTGLGVGLLVQAGGRWVPVAGEGGHVDLGPRTQREEQIWLHLDRVEGRVSAEQVLCGAGLCNVYLACCEADEVEPEFTEPSEISAAAMNDSNTQSTEALNIFSSCLGRIAGDLAISTTARGGVYIAGGIAKKILPFLARSSFRREFDDKAPHIALMQKMPTYVVEHALPALVGLAAYAHNPDTFCIEIEERCWKD